MESGKVGAIIVAAGQSSRMGGADKIFSELDGRPLLARVIDIFQACEAIDEIVIVLGQENLKRGQMIMENSNWEKVTALCQGGRRRQDSVKEGLKRLTDCRWVVIHDGARPLLSPELIERGLVEAQKTGAAIAAVPVKDTIKIAAIDGFVRDTLQRDTLWAAQTPQVFRFDLISQAHERITEDVTDDAMMLEEMGYKVKLYMGSYDNIKVTTPGDLALVETILRKKQG